MANFCVEITMEVYMCGFNVHHQIRHSPDDHKDRFTNLLKVLRSPRLSVRCALWSSMIIESNDLFIHQGFHMSGFKPVLVDGPPSKNIRSVFGDASGVLGALSTDGGLYLFREDPIVSRSPQFTKYQFDEDYFIVQHNLAIDHLAIADNGEVCVCTSGSFHLASLAVLILTASHRHF